MREFQLVNLADLALVGDPVPLPPEFANLSDAVISDFSAHIDPPPVGYAGRGLWPLVVTPPDFDAATEADTGVLDRASRTVEHAARVVRALTGKRALTASEIAARRDDLLAYVGAARWDREMAGVQFGGMTIATDDRSKTLLNGARTKADADPAYSTRWKVGPTQRITISASQIAMMSDLVLDFVDACFKADEQVTNEVLAGQWKTEAEIRDRIWAILPADWSNG